MVDLKDPSWTPTHDALEAINVLASTNDEGAIQYEYSALGSHSCSSAELGLGSVENESEVKFFETKSAD